MPHLTTASGLTWHYDLDGEGDPIVFLHGWGVNGRIWRQQSKYFSRSHKTICIDLPGHGKSSWKKIPMVDIARDFCELMQALGIKKFGVVASSLGGLVALRVYAHDPSMCKYLVLVGSQPKFARSHDYPFGLEVDRIRHLANQLETAYPNIINIFFRSLFTREERDTRRFKWIQTFRKTDQLPDKVALLELLDILEREDLRETLHKVDVPLQFINGTEDQICRRELYDDLQGKMPRAQFHWFEHCGHFPFLSKPHEFNQVLQTFIQSVN